MKIFVIGDTHFPYCNLDSLTAIYSAISIEKPNIVVQIGDLCDMFAYGKFPRTLESLSPAEEIARGREMAVNMWRAIQKIVPRAQCYQILGNHDVRPERKVLQEAAELEMLVARTMKEYFTFDKVRTIHDPRQELILDDNLMFIHGWSTRPGAHIRHVKNHYHVIHGHTHRASIVHSIYDGRVAWELDVGFVGDPQSKALSYTAQRWHNWTQAYGLIVDKLPKFVLL